MADGHGMKDGDLQEEEVWAVVKGRSEDSNPKQRKGKDSSAWLLLAAAPRGIPRANSSSHDQAKMAQQSSAPVKIPDWSKIYRKNSKKGLMEGSWVDNGNGENDGDVNVDGGYHSFVDDAYDEDYDDDDDEIVPPHEYIARKLARSQISSFSMCEGIGRTLKGRDLSKVRNAILTKTGFLE